jgi:hypothetical protein
MTSIIGVSPRGNLYRVNHENERVYRECGPGWSRLINPLVLRATEIGARVEQIKEKFGGLRFYWSPAEDSDEKDDIELAELVSQAEADSFKTCEMCGVAGQTMIKAGWYKTLCPEHARDQGYREYA